MQPDWQYQIQFPIKMTRDAGEVFVRVFVARVTNDGLTA